MNKELEPEPEPTREQIALALLSVLDGTNDHDIPNVTGLHVRECERIAEIRRALNEEMPDWPHRTY